MILLWRTKKSRNSGPVKALWIFNYCFVKSASKASFSLFSTCFYWIISLFGLVVSYQPIHILVCMETDITIASGQAGLEIEVSSPKRHGYCERDVINGWMDGWMYVWNIHLRSLTRNTILYGINWRLNMKKKNMIQVFSHGMNENQMYSLVYFHIQITYIFIFHTFTNRPMKRIRV